MFRQKITHTIGVLLLLALLFQTSTIVLAYDSKTVAGQGGVSLPIVRLENERVQALLRGDVTFIERHYADDYITTSASGLVRNKAEVIADMKSGAIKWASMTHDDVRLRVYGDTVIVTGLDSSKGVDRGRDSSGQRRFTRVWVRNGERWILVANHTTRIS